MSYGFGLTIESMVAILLLLTILYCARLNKQIGRLKADERMMKTTVADLLAATEKAERAIAGLKTTVHETDDTLGVRLREAQACCGSLGDHLRAGEDLLIRLRKIAYANSLLGGESEAQRAPSAPSVSPNPACDAKAVAAAAQAVADRARARALGQAA